MATFVTLLLMVAIFIGVLYLGKYAWRHWGKKVAHHDLPVKPMLLISLLAGLLAVAGGVVFLRVLVIYAPSLTVKPKAKVRPQRFATKVDLVQQEPRIKVVVNDSADDVPLPGDLLRRCADVEITYVSAEGNVKCFAEGSPEALQLLQRSAPTDATPLCPESVPPVEAMKQSFILAVSTTPTEVAKDVAARTGINRYAEVIYFMLTFLGVFLRICWDANQQQKQESKPALLTISSLTTGLVLAIATYALVIQSGMTGASDVLNFRTGIFVIYNGLLSPSILRDVKSWQTPPTAVSSPPS